MTLSLEFYRSVPKYVAARAVAKKIPGLLAGPVSSLRLVNRDEPELPARGWGRVRPLMSGICGSDLSMISAGSSFYFSGLVSMPFVPGHEVVGEVVDGIGAFKAGERVVLDPVLACRARGIDPPCGPCTQDDIGLCERITAGHLSAGLQTGYCGDTSGGWSELLIAHESQLHRVPGPMADETALMVEPMACALHAVKRAAPDPEAKVLLVGAGTVGLLTLIALKQDGVRSGNVTVVAKHPHQAALAARYGADEIVSAGEALGAVRRSTRAFRVDPERSAPFLLGGVDVAFDCVGSKQSLDLAMRATRAQGRVVMSGMPGGADLSPAWFRELEVIGAYSGAGAFPEALELAADAELGKLVSALYPLEHWREAMDHALSAGSLGATKVAFDLRLRFD